MSIGAMLAFSAICAVWQFVAFHFGFKRYVVGFEFAVAVVCLSMGWRWFGTGLFLLSLLLEATLGGVSLLKIFDLQQLITMGGFVMEANSRYLMIFVGGLVLLSAFWGALVWLVPSGAGLSRRIVLVGLASLVLLQGSLSFADGNFWAPVVVPQKRLLLGSEALYIREQLKLNQQVFELVRSDNVAYLPIKHASAVQTVWPQGPTARKTMLIVAESWGLPKNPDWLNAQLAPLRELEGENLPIESISLGSVHAVGTTAFGEFRELCGRLPTKLNLKDISRELLGDCLPVKLEKRGYRTVAMHGAAASMYERQNWYPVLGFQTLLFSDSLSEKLRRRCHSFPGLCDSELAPIVGTQFDTDAPVFVYWLSLNSHMPYDERDLTQLQPALCQVFAKDIFSEQLCNYHQLHRQFFENLAALLSSPTMRGIEVLVVGDHAPPFNISTARDAFVGDRVPYVHIRVR